MERLTIDLHEGEDEAKTKHGQSGEDKKCKVEELIEEEDNAKVHEHDDKLAHRNGPQDLVFDFDELGNNELIGHTQ